MSFTPTTFEFASKIFRISVELRLLPVQPGEVVSASVVTWVTGGSDIPRDGYALCTISFYKDLSSGRMGYKEASVAAKDMAYPNYKTLKVENVTVPDGANYMTLLLIIRGASNCTKLI